MCAFISSALENVQSFFESEQNNIESSTPGCSTNNTTENANSAEVIQQSVAHFRIEIVQSGVEIQLKTLSVFIQVTNHP